MLSLSGIVSDYSDWVSEDQLILLVREDCMTGERASFVVKASKRGNDVYRDRVSRKFRDVIMSIPDEYQTAINLEKGWSFA
jgi:RNase P protein component